MENGRTYKQNRYKQILEEQISISYASKGISIADTDELSPYDRGIILDSITEIKEMEREAAEAAANPNMIHSFSTSRYRKR